MGRERQQLARTGRAETMGVPWVTSQAMLCGGGGGGMWGRWCLVSQTQALSSKPEPPISYLPPPKGGAST